MPSKICTLHIDFRLNVFPSEDDMETHIVGPLKAMTGTDYFETSFKSGKTLTRSFVSKDENKDLFILIRVYDRNDEDEKVLVTILLECPKAVEEIIECRDGMDLECTLKEQFEKCFDYKADGSTFYPVLRRCIKDPPYLRSSDDRMLEYAFKKVCFSAKSDFQYVQIVDTIDFGKTLILDEMVNLAESDTEYYTHNLMCLPSGFESKYKDAKILILGGGDGALMKELLELKSPPAFVTMIEIDDVVMDAVNTHMPSVSGPYLRRDNREGPRHKIIVGDAIAFMKEQLKSGTEYDFIFGDLTDTPVSTGPRDNSLWEFLKTIIGMGMQLLKPETGYYMTHCNGINVPDAIAEYEKVLKQMYNGKCTFTSTNKFVPSFMETWVYYQIQRHE